MQFSEKKVLLSDEDYNKLLNLSKKKDSDVPTGTDIQLQKLNNDFIKNKIIKENMNAQLWQKLDKRLQTLSPIKTNNVSQLPVSSLLAATQPSSSSSNVSQFRSSQPPQQQQQLQQQQQSFSSPSKGRSEENVREFLEENTNKTNRNKVLRLYDLLIRNPSVDVTPSNIYVAGTKIVGSTVNVLKHLVGRAAKLTYNVDLLLAALSEDPSSVNLIHNKQASSILRDLQRPSDSQGQGPASVQARPRTSTPYSSPAKRTVTPLKDIKDISKLGESTLTSTTAGDTKFFSHDDDDDDDDEDDDDRRYMAIGYSPELAAGLQEDEEEGEEEGAKKLRKQIRGSGKKVKKFKWQSLWS